MGVRAVKGVQKRLLTVSVSLFAAAPKRWYTPKNVSTFHPFRQSSSRGQRAAAVVVSVTALSLTGVWLTAHTDEVVITHRKRRVLLSPQQELALGRTVFKAAARNAKPADDAQVKALRSVCQRIAVACDRLGTPLVEPQFEMVKSKQINAFCAPG